MALRRRYTVIALLFVVLAAAAIAASGAFELARREYERRQRERHVAAGEVALKVRNPAGAALALHRAGGALEAAAAVPLGGETWLAEGRYFVEASLGRTRLFYPVAVDARSQPPEDADWTVTVRRPPREEPPVLETGGLGFAYVPGGDFLMGERGNPGEPHVVFVPGFHLAAFEVTNREFRLFLAARDGYDDPANWTAAGWARRSTGASQATARLTPADERYARFGRDDLPVVLVSWFEAAAYGRWLTRRIGGGRWLFRMPTEAEWEKASRGPDGFDYGLGMELSEAQAALYNWRKNPGAAVTLVGRDETRRSYRPSRYGIFHASGNAREWTQSVFRRMNAAHPWRDDGRNDEEPPGFRVTRGGSWYSASAVRLQLAYREEFQPELTSDDLGFRIAAFLGPAPTGP